MNCKKCGALVDAEAKFCPYCGGILKTETETSTYQDPFSAYRNTNTHQEQYQYQQTYSNVSNNGIQYADDFKKKEEVVNKDNKSLIGLILSIVSIPLTFVHTGIGIALIVIGFILVILGFKTTSKGMRIASLIISIISLIVVILSTVFMFVASIEISFSNGYRTNIGNYFKSAFFNGYNSDEIEGYWVSSKDELFYLDSDGTYHLYMDKDNLEDDYFNGYYNVDFGYDLEDGTIFEDEDYFYYSIDTYGNETSSDFIYSEEILKLLEDDIIIKIDKDDFDEIVLYFVNQNTEIELNRY